MLYKIKIIKWNGIKLKNIFFKFFKVRLDILMLWVIRVVVVMVLIMWFNELEKWWFGDGMFE